MERTGLKLDSYFSASKIEWILNNIPKARELLQEKRLLVGTIDTYLMWQLSGGKIYKTDYINAFRTMLFNIHHLVWDDYLCNLFQVPKEILPEVCPSSHYYGMTDAEILGFEIPICGEGHWHVTQSKQIYKYICMKEKKHLKLNKNWEKYTQNGEKSKKKEMIPYDLVL